MAMVMVASTLRRLDDDGCRDRPDGARSDDRIVGVMLIGLRGAPES
jgi:hypothetical protein